MIEIKMPQWGMTLTEGTITKWLKHPGDKVGKGEALCEVEEAKVTDMVESPEAGVLTEIRVEEGSTVAVLTVICIIDESA